MADVKIRVIGEDRASQELSKIDKHGNYILGTKDDESGVYKVTFRDTTVLPGRYIFEIEDYGIDLLSTKILRINNQEHRWIKIEE